eukprot:6081476-Ditylum_brightwellii.AAC.1
MKHPRKKAKRTATLVHSGSLSSKLYRSSTLSSMDDTDSKEGEEGERRQRQIDAQQTHAISPS